MPGWLRRLFRRRRDIDDGFVVIKDGDGKALRLPERRRKQREPFRGRPSLEPAGFEMLSGYVRGLLGMSIGIKDREFLESRLIARLRALDIASFEEYAGFLMSPRGQKEELDIFIDAITTQKTHLWRESDHFEFLMDRAIAELIGTRKALRAWSVGCSTGEETYSIAMALSEYARRHGDFTFSVLGTDVSSLALERAARARYTGESALHLPAELGKRYLSEKGDRHEVVGSLRERVGFRRLNLKDGDYSAVGEADIVFFRNVGIYFDRETRAGILERICARLTQGGYLFLGHSEGLEGYGVMPLEKVQGDIYRRI